MDTSNSFSWFCVIGLVILIIFMEWTFHKSKKKCQTLALDPKIRQSDEEFWNQVLPYLWTQNWKLLEKMLML